ncbi:MAG: hypothetical protein GY953_21520, partial [bacterium]|nr:hypothetical protein [bacterium]
MIVRFVLPFLIAGAAFAQQQSRFDDLEVCSLCHSQLTDSGRVIGPSELWPGSMMAHAARDPYWKAKIRFETATTPALTEVIEDTCLRCHAPMQQYDLRPAGQRLDLDEVNAIGKQGVGCTVCHQITGEGLGTKASFEAGFT